MAVSPSLLADSRDVTLADLDDDREGVNMLTYINEQNRLLGLT